MYNILGLQTKTTKLVFLRDTRISFHFVGTRRGV